MAVMCTPTVNGFGRFRPNALAPHSILWGRDNRGAMLRVIGSPGDAGTRIETDSVNRPPIPTCTWRRRSMRGWTASAAVWCRPRPRARPTGAAMRRGFRTTSATRSPALAQDPVMRAGFGAPFIDYYQRIKQAERVRAAAADDPLEFHRREYFGRI
jgi:glutamine synthetase